MLLSWSCRRPSFSTRIPTCWPAAHCRRRYEALYEADRAGGRVRTVRMAPRCTSEGTPAASPTRTTDSTAYSRSTAVARDRNPPTPRTTMDSVCRRAEPTQNRCMIIGAASLFVCPPPALAVAYAQLQTCMTQAWPCDRWGFVCLRSSVFGLIKRMSRVVKKGNRHNDVLFRTSAYPAPYPEDTRHRTRRMPGG